jgi:2,3-bisphosphoglycerate-independent phosphoglycerate mutase
LKITKSMPMRNILDKLPKPVVLCILDGWGIGPSSKHNAITSAHTPCFDQLLEHYPHSLLSTSGLDVGLPEGQMGNSEVGHMNIGSGRIIMQDLVLIDKAIKDGNLAKSPQLVALIEKLTTTNGNCHLLGLLSDGGVHAHIEHIIALARIISAQGIQVFVHAFTDGRDTQPYTALNFVKQFKKAVEGSNLIKIATVSGRYFAMDRDHRWDRIELAYNAIVLGEGLSASSAELALEYSYSYNTSDEFVHPTVMEDYPGVQAGDGIIMANFRADRARQLLNALSEEQFDGFVRKKIPNFAYKVGMTEYSPGLATVFKPLFPSPQLTNTLPEIIAKLKLKQLRIAETEKYAHVTFFFNGGKEQNFPGEERILIPSPKVSTYDAHPEMSAREVTAELIAAINSQKFDLIIVNYANTDMVGHTGNFEATVKAVETIDECLDQLYASVKANGGLMLITADHGNAEQMLEPETNQAFTSHTTNPVPFIICGPNVNKKLFQLNNGKLCDIAPTILDLMNIPKPTEMSGFSLIKTIAQNGHE